MDIPNDVNEYKKQEYWDKRYTNEESYEWLRKFDDIKDVLAEQLKPHHKLLHVGCGNSSLGVDLLQAGLVDTVVNVDYSSVVIERMKKKFGESKNLQWLQMDIRELQFDSDTFDVVLDKATMDAFVPKEIYGEAPNENCQTMVNEVKRVLKGGGQFVQITFGQPHMRKKYFQPLLEQGKAETGDVKYTWKLEMKTLGGQGFIDYYYYVWTLA
eukprot:TRINITY_DN63987_c0_g1_i4.p1 TRINITY_DN63987_c0_g1~~TRINITY_DN63987_c0_g1_i4.p1  ORF type:complete len:212 (+),score=31.48 TRINITY_DN63987_c0_g1_i4:28-663(+)